MPQLMQQCFKHIFLLALPGLLYLFCTLPVYAADNSTIVAEDKGVLPQVLVVADKITPTTGLTIFDRELIESLPLANGSVSEMIGPIPTIQYSEDANTSFLGGEIAPPYVSISGSRYYDNNFTIDGFSNNSPLDPATQLQVDANKLPGHPEIHFLNPRLIEQTTVYNSNIPAEFGGFIGGQVDTLTIEPGDQPSVQIDYRTTSDSWTRFHIDPYDQEAFDDSHSSSMQPNFKKQNLGLTLSTPLTTDSGIVASYQRLTSDIPLSNLTSRISERREQQNLFLKLSHYLPSSDKLSLTALYTPTSARYFITDGLNSRIQNDSDNVTIGLAYNRLNSLGELKTNLAYTQAERSRSSAKDKYQWDPSTASIDWESGLTGGIGDLETRQRSLSLKSALTFDEITTGPFSHHLKAGVESNLLQQRYHRPETSYSYYSADLYSDAAFSCTSGDSACIAGEQFLTRRTVYQQATASHDALTAEAFIQDIISWKRVELFPGLRLSYDDYTHEKNVAPRLSLSWDLRGDRKTVVFAGKNRYYSAAIKNYSLYRAIRAENQTRSLDDGVISDWSGSPSLIYVQTDVKTPYADEETVGVIQKLFNGDFKLQYIRKTSKNEFARDYERIDGINYYTLNNLGRSDYESVQLSWQRSWQNRHFEVNYTWQESNTSNDDYDDLLSLDDLGETVWYKDEELYPFEIPRTDFNRPFVINLLFHQKLPGGFSFTNRTKIRGPYQKLSVLIDEDGIVKRDSVLDPDQGEVYVYEKVKTQTATTFDWHLAWSPRQQSGKKLELTLDILNVFNRRNKYKYSTGTYGYDYELGRQFWAGVSYTF